MEAGTKTSLEKYFLLVTFLTPFYIHPEYFDPPISWFLTTFFALWLYCSCFFTHMVIFDIHQCLCILRHDVQKSIK